ncbi:MAG: efflux RND transporter periplasmic adaptor subunit [Spirosomataceae bacterium]
MRPLLIIGALILLLFVGKQFFWGESKDQNSTSQGGAPGQKTPTSSLPVDIFITQINDADQLIYASGTAVPNEEVELRSETSGRIVQLNIQEGGVVQKGQMIAKIKDDDLRAQLKKIQLEQTLANQIEARQKKLLDINAISREEYDLAVNKVNTLKADEELLRVQLDRTTIRAPFTGRIGLKSISVGAYITPTNVIATLVQINPIKIDFSVPEKYLSNVRVGQTVQFEVDGLKEGFTAKINAIDPQVDASLRTLRVRAVASNQNNKLLPGMFTRIQLAVASNRSIMVPTDAVVPILDGKQVYVMQNGKATPRQIVTGIRDQKYVEVLSGLQVGDSLIVSAIMSLRPEMPVKAKLVK